MPAETPVFTNEDTVIFFDWDDTLIPSSFLAENGLRLDSPEEQLILYQDQLKDLEDRVKTVLTLAMQMGKVMIVTNAENGWVQLSAQKFLPGLTPFIEKLDVLSARSTYENMFDSPLKWKYYAFQQQLSNILSEKKRFMDTGSDSIDCNIMPQNNIISFGDSHVEREAIRAVCRSIPNATTKSVKFAERPSLEQLLRQIELVTKCFGYIHSHDGDLDLQLTVTVNNEQSTPKHSNQSIEKENRIQNPTF